MSSKVRAGLLVGLALVLPIAASAEPISVEEAVRRAVEASPAIQAQQAGVQSATAGRGQASVRPNPVVMVEAENFAGTGPFNIYGQAETTVTYSQTIERGGKREARIAWAERDIGLAEASVRLARLDVAQAVQRAFLDLQIAEEVVWLAERRLATEQEMQTEALRRVRGFADPLFVESRAEARVSQARLAHGESVSLREASRARLASFWGGDRAEVEVPRGIERPDVEDSELAEADRELASAGIERAQAAVVIEKTRGVQDYTVSGGVRHLRESGDVALVAGVSILIGRFDRNQGNIARAQADRQRIELGAEAARLDRLRRLLRRSSGSEDRPAPFAAQYALSHVCWLIAYPVAGQIGAALGFGRRLV